MGVTEWPEGRVWGEMNLMSPGWEVPVPGQRGQRYSCSS